MLASTENVTYVIAGAIENKSLSDFVPALVTSEILILQVVEVNVGTVQLKVFSEASTDEAITVQFEPLSGEYS
ncbi:MAG TPA: hypothetical protein PK980_07535, partial [Paludibacteraceae bacterium]|nr:hypothetical protein [Paludibacteraceae bacterium]